MFHKTFNIFALISTFNVLEMKILMTAAKELNTD